MSTEIVIDPRFREPPNSANGGYACGIVGEGIGGVATATLRRPPPLDAPLSLVGDGLRILPARLDGSTVVAAPWAPDESLAGAGGVIERSHVWAALDCRSYFEPDDAPMALLGHLTARIDRLPEIGERLVVIGWPIGVEGRKHYAGSALLADNGAELAVAAATWIEIDRLPT
jgi:hypothetical protein